MLVIIHGWSDDSKSFEPLGKKLRADGVTTEVAHVKLGDYISMDDDVTYDDVAEALEKAWVREQLPTDPRSVDVIVHSTGGLVIRHWMTRHKSPATNPIHRLLMLAPANFGSPLAHKGRSFIGRVAKGFKSDKPFQTGTHILKGLELASPFSWDLALRDCFSDQVWYGPGKVLCTVLVGSSGYSGISAIANENGTDGTVRVSTANLHPKYISMNFANDPCKPEITVRNASVDIAFARIPGENHSTIAFKDKGPKNPQTYEKIKRALAVTDTDFLSWKDELDKFSAEAREAGADDNFTHGYQNTVICLKDNCGNFINDYFLELFAKKPGSGKVDEQLTAHIQEKVLTTTHAYEDNKAFRSLMIDATEFAASVTNRPLYVSVSALPDIRETGTVGYSTFGYNDIGSIEILSDALARLIAPDRTVLIEMTIRRDQTDKVFRFRELP